MRAKKKKLALDGPLKAHFFWPVGEDLSKLREPRAITFAKRLIDRFKVGSCPMIDDVRMECVWTCRDCERTVPPTLTGGRSPKRTGVKCRLLLVPVPPVGEGATRGDD